MKLKAGIFLITLALMFCMFGCAMKSVDDLQQPKQAEAGGCAEFYDVKWGMTADEVKALAGRPYAESETALEYLSAEMFKISGSLNCTFDESGLKSVNFEAVSDDAKEAKALVEKLFEDINGRYGMPKENKLTIDGINGDYTWTEQGATIRLYNYEGTNIVYLSYSKPL